MPLVQSSLGICVLIGIAYLLGEQKNLVRWRSVLVGIAAQLAIALVLLRTSIFEGAFLFIAKGVVVIEESTVDATRFMFGYLVGGGPRPFELVDPGQDAVLAFRVLPLIMVISAISSLLYYWRIIPTVIRILARPIRRIMGVSGTLAFAAAASNFFGVIETPILIRPYLKKLSRSEIFAVLVCSMSTISGAVMVLYASVLGVVVDAPMTHILVASVISIPAALNISHLMLAEAPSIDKTTPKAEQEATHWIEALMQGTLQGMRMVVYVVAIIVVLFALINIVNRGLALFPSEPEIQSLVGWLFRPLLWLTGMSWEDAQIASSVMGTKLVLNEFVAYLELAKIGAELSDRGRLILIYVVCGAGNLASVGIIAGSMGAIVPERQNEIAKLALKAVVGGTLATLMTGAVVAILQT